MPLLHCNRKSNLLLHPSGDSPEIPARRRELTVATSSSRTAGRGHPLQEDEVGKKKDTFKMLNLLLENVESK
jgi:hypothetical protein